jgi:hypothetical protein
MAYQHLDEIMVVCQKAKKGHLIRTGDRNRKHIKGE